MVKDWANSTIVDIREAYRDDAGVMWEIAVEPASAARALVARSPSGAELRVSVEEVLEDSSGVLWHRTRKPLAIGTRVHLIAG